MTLSSDEVTVCVWEVGDVGISESVCVSSRCGSVVGDCSDKGTLEVLPEEVVVSSVECVL